MTTEGSENIGALLYRMINFSLMQKLNEAKFKRSNASMAAYAFALLFLLEREFELKIEFVVVTIRICMTSVLQKGTISCCGLGQCFQHGVRHVAMTTNAVVRFAVCQSTAGRPFLLSTGRARPPRARDGVRVAAGAAALVSTAGLLLRS
jgi:hypothetical protein